MPKLLRKRRNREVVSRKKKIHKNVRVNKIQNQVLRKTLLGGKNMPWSQHLEKINRDLPSALGESFPETIPEEAKHKLKLNEQQIPIVEKMHKKHGLNFYKMSLDHKTNVYQWTETVCEKYVRGWCVDKTIPQRSLEAENLSGRGIDLRKPADWKCRKKNVFGH